MTARQTVPVLCTFLLALFIAAPAHAQSHSITLSGQFGYLFANINGDNGEKIPNGWIAALDVTFDGRYAGVVEFAGNYPSDEHMYRSVLAGGRYFFKKTGPVTPFVQLLAGQARSSAIGDETNAFTLQPGAGIDWNVAPHFGVRIQGDYDWRTRSSGDVTGYRFAASIVIR